MSQQKIKALASQATRAMRDLNKISELRTSSEINNFLIDTVNILQELEQRITNLEEKNK